MENIRSQMRPLLTLRYLSGEDENKIFDRKSAQIKVSDIASLISAFANAEGGTIAVGISDKTRKIEGINKIGPQKINDFISAPKDFCKPMPRYKEEFLEVVNEAGEQDRILLLHIDMSVDQVIRTSNDSTYLRIGDRTKELRGDDLRNLEYSKSMRHYEDECSMDAEIDDLDVELLEQYRNTINAQNDSFEQVLAARGFLKKQQGKFRLTNAAVLLFAKNIQQFYPNCRVRFIRYDGTSAGVGTRLNVTKDVNVELPLLRIIDKAQEFIGTQLREFTALDGETGKFKTVPEYPEFAWKEGIVNAVTHREYAMSGNYIKVSMYDDRLEIESPGRLPNIVTVENIKETRFARNPRISRVLTEFGWVRELNEGVKRIYSDMAEFFLDAPIYSEPEQGVRLILKNNIVARRLRQTSRAAENVGVEQWNDLDGLEHLILTLLTSRGAVRRTDIEQYTGKAARTINTRLKHLLELNIIIANGNKYDPKRTYELRPGSKI